MKLITIHLHIEGNKEYSSQILCRDGDGGVGESVSYV